QYIGNDRAFHEFSILLWNSGIDMAADIGIGPTIEAAVLNGSGVLGRQIVSEVVAFVHAGPDGGRPRLQRQTYRVPQSGSEDSVTGPVRIVLMDHRALFVSGTLLVDVVGRSDRHIHLPSVRAEQDGAGEMISSAGKIRELLAVPLRLGVTG